MTASIGRLSWSADEKLRHTVRADVRVDPETVKALKDAAKRDRAELPTMQHVLAYCLKLGIETYLEGQPDESPLPAPPLADKDGH